MANNLTSEDLQNIEKLLDPRFEKIEQNVSVVNDKIDHLTNVVDRFAKTAQDQKQEFIVLRGQHVQMRRVLIKKGITHEDELAIS